MCVELSVAEVEHGARARQGTLCELTSDGPDRQLDDRTRRDEQLGTVVTRLAAGIAHDFNNLLAVILGATSELSGRADPETEELCRSIATAAERGVDLVSRLLVVAGRQTLDPVPLDVRGFVSSMLPGLRRTLGVEIALVDSRTSPWALADRAGLECAILQLCVNAREAMGSNGRLQIEIAHEARCAHAARDHEQQIPSECVALSVTDAGKGIGPEDLEHVHEPYFTTKPPGLGIGLGLSMVHGFVRQSRGHLDVDSELGWGTTVTMHLPAIPAPDGGAAVAALGDGESDAPGDPTTTGPPDDPTDRRASARPVDPRADDAVADGSTGSDVSAGDRASDDPVHRLRVLVVDDDELLRGLVVRQVERLAHLAIGVGSVGDARGVLGQEHVDLLLTDVRLGGDEDGVDLAARALQERPDLPIVVMSGLVDDIYLPVDKTVTVLRKPFTQSELSDAIDRVLGR